MTTYQAETAAEASAESTDAAAARLMGILNDGSAAVLISIGHQTGLFDVLAALPPATSTQIADASGLNERYVREWLGGMVTTGIVHYGPATKTYALDPAYVPSMTGTGVDNLARTLTFVTLMGEVAGKVAGKFRTGGGLHYAEYPGFVAIQAADSASVHDFSLVDVILPLSGRVSDLQAGITVADIGCGAGHAINLMAQAFPASSFTGYDFFEEAIDAGRTEAQQLGLANVRFELADAAALELREELDLITVFDAVHDQAHPAAVLRNIRRALKPGGTFLMVDIKASSNLEENVDLPWAAFLYAISTTHCMSVSLAQDGDGLGTVWGVQQAEAMLRGAGFNEVRVLDLAEDPFNAYFVASV
ncbi:Methyltransferase type 11 [Pseudarthrobacter chlorophenolicus A6]|uniref:Methyltransferase type 11 n=1 Tax=Pseudarthrobacter chlorophenolicus (strain ATCC 700700 / DSM 12829 / CIP 107037 / JCM 12360 / KCTC 9906 / NCIMB 13794 / A6) TaxID=452863 RepID=B8H7J0_PSECP|nr:class I SAM-dependent methyltransferase [Pseudarthrobacter chlorophenolicus]ACL39770.1 Methyltransferase type 11 [Pseudarthrobacter chlorophenolicus A6]SDQ93999.1 Methyltransferase domain-containing protein [Pseudarthrobacter chlorophenolicus]